MVLSPPTYSNVSVLRVGRHAGDTEHGDTTSLVQVWKTRKMVVAFLRHFGCRFCKQQVEQIKSIVPQLRNAGVGVAVVSIGTLAQGLRWRDEVGWTGELYVDTDPDTPASYPTFRLAEGKMLFGHEDVKSLGAEALKQGHKDGGYATGDSPWTGNVLQAGGVFVLGPGNTCDYSFRSEYVGHHPENEDIVAAATGTDKGGAPHVFASTKHWVNKLNVHKRVTVTSPHVVHNLFGLSVGVVVFALLHAYLTVHPVVLGMPVFAVGLLWWKRHALLSLVRRAKDPPVRLLTPEEVDAMLVRAGIVQCDCAEQLSGQNVVDVLQVPNTPPGAEGPSGGDADEETLIAYQAFLCFLREFLAKWHPSLGRKGPICPFVPNALKNNVIYVSVIRTGDDTNATTVYNCAKRFVKRFSELEPTTGRQVMNKCVVLVFPDVPVTSAPDYIDRVQVQLKALFVEQGLMIGEFHMYNNTPGLHNPSFFPLRTPFPSLAIRHMVPSDLVFLDLNRYEPELRRKFLVSFLARFDVDDPPLKRTASYDRQVERAKVALAELQAK